MSIDPADMALGFPRFSLLWSLDTVSIWECAAIISSPVSLICYLSSIHFNNELIEGEIPRHLTLSRIL
jgi:hypothetical protein